MKVTIIGKPAVIKYDKYKTKRARQKAQDHMNLLCLAKVLEKTDSKNHISLNFEANSFWYYFSTGEGWQLDGSSESLMHLINHEWLLEQIMGKEVAA